MPPSTAPVSRRSACRDRRAVERGGPRPHAERQDEKQDGDRSKAQRSLHLRRGADILKGYWNAPDLTAEAIVNGYYRTGDLFEITGERLQYYRYVGRSKDLVIRGGMNISSEEVESLLIGCPGVREVAVFLSASETHNKKNVNKTVAATLSGFEDVIGPAVAGSGDVKINGRDALRVGGVGGIIGDPQKPNRRRSDDFLLVLSHVLEAEPEVVVLHEGPDDPDTRRRGNPDIRALLEVAAPGTLVLCGHCHWHEPLATLGEGCQVLNSDGRAVLLQAAG